MPSTCLATGQSQEKLWWRLVAMLTCKSFVILWFRGERQTEPSHSGFFSAVSLRITGAEQLYQAKRMVRWNQERVVLDLYSNFE